MNVEAGLRLEAAGERLVHHLAAHRLAVVRLAHGDSNPGHGGAVLEVLCSGHPRLPPLPAQPPAEAGGRVAGLGRALHLHFSARSGHERSAKW